MFEDVSYKLEKLILVVWKEGGSELIFHFQFGVSMLMILMKWILSCYCWKYMIDNFVGKMFSDNFYENFEWIFYLQIDKGFHISSFNQHFYKLLKLRRLTWALTGDSTPASTHVLFWPNLWFRDFFRLFQPIPPPLVLLEDHKQLHQLFRSKSIVNGWSCSIMLLLLKIISDSKTLSQKNFRPIFLRGTPAQFFFWKRGKWLILSTTID